MSLAIRNTRDLIHPDKFKWKVLLFSLSGLGKTTWASDAPELGVIACETGEGKGQLSIADKGLDFVEPSTYKELEQICSGMVFKDKQSISLDSLTDICNTIIKDEALSIPRQSGNSPKRAKGVPEQDDYGVMGELTRRLVRKLLDTDKNVIATATMRIKEPNAENGQGQFLIGPDLPGAMMLGSCAMFDTVMCLKSRSRLRDPKDAKSRFTERYFVTASDGNGLIAKCRSVISGGPSLLAYEEPYDLATGAGSFPFLLAKIKKAYTEFYERVKHPVMVSVAALEG